MQIITADSGGIPPALQAPAEAAIAWLNAQDEASFELTGLVDADLAQAALAGDAQQGFELGLILCDGDICAREQVLVRGQAPEYQFSRVAQAGSEIPPLLDPPPGVRASWLDQQLAKHEFVLLLFYRGLW